MARCEGECGGKRAPAEAPTWEDLWRQWCEAGLEPDAFWRATPRSFALIVGARLKSHADLATMIGWNAEAFARTKRMKPLDEYFKPPVTPEAKRDKGARDLKRMFDRRIAHQEKETP